MARDYIIVMRKQPYNYACRILRRRNAEVEEMKQDAISNGTDSVKYDYELLLLSKVMAAFADG